MPTKHDELAQVLTLDQIEMLKGEQSRRSLKLFIQTFWHVVEPTSPFIDGIHIDALVDHLSNIRDIRSLLICMPPRHTKSLIVSVFFFAWYWLHTPSARFLFSSYSLQLSLRDSLKCRRLIESELFQKYYHHIFKLTGDQNTKSRFENDKNGFRLATSMDGSATGEGGEIIVADDPMNLQDSESKIQREMVTRWYSEVFHNRVNDARTGCRIIVMQRCHSDDLAGWLIDNDRANNWTKLIMSLEAGKSSTVSTRWSDPRTTEGEILCPERFPPAEVAALKQTLGSRAFNAQYNQNPAPSDDALIKDLFETYDETPTENSFRLCAVDLAISTRTGADYTVIVTADISFTGDLFILDVHRERMASGKIIPTLQDIHERYKPYVILIEDVSFQRIVIQEARAKHLPVRPVRPEGDKQSRSVMLQVAVEQGRVYLPREAEWKKTFIDELTHFPQGRHDDIVDCCSYLAIEANRLCRRPPTWRSPQKQIVLSAQEQAEQTQKEMTAMLNEGLF